MTGVLLLLIVLAPGLSLWWLAMHVVIAAGLSLPWQLAIPWTASAVGMALACAWLATDDFDPRLLILMAFGAGAMAVRQLSISVGQLHLAREELARLAVAEERLRFSRDLHDLLGHAMSMVVLKSELAGRLLPMAPERARAEVGDVEVAAREALRQVRDAVAGYRQPTLRAELAAAPEVLNAAGIGVRIDDSAGGLAVAVDTLLAWAVREGVTNVVRHSRASVCTIRTSADHGLARIEITNNGRGAAPSHASGSGLAGLAERAIAINGCMRAGPLLEGGFALLGEAPVGTIPNARSS
jgi:two-component system, NarL family, sensor histidine kinase DesK